MKTTYLGYGDGWLPAGAFWRLLATLLDIALYCGICTLLALPAGLSFDASALWGGIDDLARAVSDPIWSGHASGILGLWIALWWCYFIVSWGLLGASPGKWAFGLRIIDYHQRCPIGPARAALRLVAYAVSSITFEWGHVLIVLRQDRRALHDILAGTRVVRRSPRRIRNSQVSEAKDETPNNETAADEEFPEAPEPTEEHGPPTDR
jgi:uncharacterized RDD family membrane protein YckC